MFECARYPASLQVDPLVRRNAEMPGDLLQPVAFQAAQRDVVELHEKIGIYDMAAVHIPSGIIDDLLRQGHHVATWRGMPAGGMKPAGGRVDQLILIAGRIEVAEQHHLDRFRFDLRLNGFDRPGVLLFDAELP